MFGFEYPDPNEKITYENNVNAISKVVPKFDKKVNIFDYRH